MPDRRFEYLVLGAGAIGSIIGAHLARAGRPVAMVARGRRALQVKEQGLRIHGLSSFTEAVPVITDLSRCPDAEVLIVATKALDTAKTLEPFRARPPATALSIQNGVMKNLHLAAAFGEDRVLGAIANTSGELQPDGRVLFTRNELIAVGETAVPMSARAQRIAEDLDRAGVRARAVPDIRNLEWAKFAAWSALMLASVTTRARSGVFLSDPGVAGLIVRSVREIGGLASRCGIVLSDESALPVASLCAGPEAAAVALVLSIGREMSERAPHHRMSSLQDLDAGRPLEIDETLGYALRLAAGLCVPMPLLEIFHPLAAAIDRINRGQPIESAATGAPSDSVRSGR